MAATGAFDQCEGVQGAGRAEAVCSNSACRKAAAEGQRLRRCRRCKSVFYCSDACQHTDWRRHKRAECVAAAAAAAAAERVDPGRARKIAEQLNFLVDDPEAAIKSEAELMVEILGRGQPESQRQALREGLERCIREHVPNIAAAWSATRGR